METPAQTLPEEYSTFGVRRISRHAVLRYMQRILKRPVPDAYFVSSRERAQVEALVWPHLMTCRYLSDEEKLVYADRRTRKSIDVASRAKSRGKPLELDFSHPFFQQNRYLTDDHILYAIREDDIVTIWLLEEHHRFHMARLRMEGVRFPLEYQLDSTTPSRLEACRLATFCNTAHAPVRPWLDRFRAFDPARVLFLLSRHLNPDQYLKDELPPAFQGSPRRLLPQTRPEDLGTWRLLAEASGWFRSTVVLCTQEDELLYVLAHTLPRDTPIRDEDQQLPLFRVFAMDPEQAPEERLHTFSLL